MNTKYYILEVLEKNSGKDISGEKIAKELNISRNAVWKAIKELKKNGYEIKAATNKGYRLCGNNDILSVQGILPYLSDRTLAKKIFIYSSLESTNNTAKELALSGAEDNTVIISDSQTMGRGRYNRTFHSPPSNGIYMSLILRSNISLFESPTIITSFAAVTVCEAIEKLSDKKPLIKWVNDIYLNNKKISGILTEAVTDFESGQPQWIVVGIGINFTEPAGDFPPEIGNIAGALFENKPAPITRNKLCAEIINSFFLLPKYYDKTLLLQKYKERLFILGKEITVISANETFNAQAIDIDNNGGLIVEKDNHEIVSLTSGEISIKL